MTAPATSSLPRVVTTAAALRAEVAANRQAGKKIGLVPTMGALHAGHVSLVDASARECGFTVVTIFVNPTQFAPHEDFNRYPRDLNADLANLAGHGADLVFAPEAADMYPPGHATRVELSGVAEPLEGRARPGHFTGVATVVLKLFNLAAPDVAFFGQKDYQQSLVVLRMTTALDLPIAIRVCPIVREPDGLAMSSRNRYLSEKERRQALTLSRSLRLGAELIGSGERNVAKVLSRMREPFAAEPEVKLEYLVLADPETLAEVTQIAGPTVALIAARVGVTRLIDNAVL